MPLSPGPLLPHDGFMSFRQSMRMVPRVRPGVETKGQGPGSWGREDGPLGARGVSSRIILIDHPRHTGRLVSRKNSAWLRLLAAMCASSLDRQLASGRRPESNRLLAARAVQLVSPSVRASLARDWRDLLSQPHQPPLARNPRVTLCRDRIIAAEGAVRDMLDALSGSRSAPARWIATASWLLSDGAGPIYNRHCATDLEIALREITAQLDPAVSQTC